MLLYVGVVLIVNGLWLIGGTRAAAVPAGERAAAGAADAGGDPIVLNGREVTVINLFTGFVGLVVAGTLLIQGNQDGDLASIRGGGFILLFAFTYLWVALNTFLDVDGRAFGWYCLFVAVTAVAAGIYTFKDAGGDEANIWLGIDWFAWAVLWFLFFMLLALGRPIARLTGIVAIIEGIATAWVFGFLLLQGSVAFP
jgi:putative amide transporter protein